MTPYLHNRLHLCGVGVCSLDGKIYMVGGLRALGGAMSSVFEYDVSRSRWSSRAPLPEATGCNVAVLDGMIYVVEDLDYVEYGWERPSQGVWSFGTCIGGDLQISSWAEVEGWQFGV